MTMWFFGLFSRRKKREKSRDTAYKRLEAILERRRPVSVTEIIPKAEFEENSEKIKEKIVTWVSDTFKVSPERVKVEFEEHNGYIVIITNVMFE
jgi:septum formation topological specificity factor MinE